MKAEGCANKAIVGRQPVMIRRRETVERENRQCCRGNRICNDQLGHFLCGSRYFFLVHVGTLLVLVVEMTLVKQRYHRLSMCAWVYVRVNW